MLNDRIRMLCLLVYTVYMRAVTQAPVDDTLHKPHSCVFHQGGMQFDYDQTYRRTSRNNHDISDSRSLWILQIVFDGHRYDTLYTWRIIGRIAELLFLALLF